MKTKQLRKPATGDRNQSNVTYPLTVADLHNKSIIDPSDYSLGASGPKTLEMQITTGFSLEGTKVPNNYNWFLLGGLKKGGGCPPSVLLRLEI